MREQITSTWLIVVFLIGAMFFISYVSGPHTTEQNIQMSNQTNLNSTISDQLISKVDQEAARIKAQ
ncbi:MAG: hypothetical protein V7727_05855 [Sneathiella sp.]